MNNKHIEILTQFRAFLKGYNDATHDENIAKAIKYLDKAITSHMSYTNANVTCEVLEYGV